VPDAADTAAALTRARRLRAEIARGAAKFEDVAKKESVDSVSGARGGDLGWVKRNEAGFDPQFSRRCGDSRRGSSASRRYRASAII